jgi:uncharacterized protein
VSLDGPPELHDAHRYGAHHTPSHAQVLRALERLHEVGLSDRTVLRGTYGPGESLLVQRLEYMNQLCDRGLASGVALEPWEMDRDSASEWAGGDWAALATEMGAVADWAAARRKSGKIARFRYIEKNLETLRTGQRLQGQCGAGRGYLTVTPDGTLHACHRATPTVIGTVSGGFDTRRRWPWYDGVPTERLPCRACALRYLCGGGCRYDAITYWKDLGTTKPAPCSCAKVAVNARLVAEVLMQEATP